MSSVGTKVKVRVRQWLTRTDNNPIPMRTMVGTVLEETRNAYRVQLHGRPEPTTHCLHCHWELTHKVSVLYGLGPVCGGHFYITNITEEQLEERMEEIRQKLEAVTWEGWIPKSQIEMLEVLEEAKKVEKKYRITFMYQGERMRTVTTEEKVAYIQSKADYVVEIEEVEAEDLVSMA